MQGGIVSTIGSNCKRCYSCIRECPAKAIKVLGGQAVVIQERCIGCGHCVTVCSQNAKEIRSDLKELDRILKDGEAIAIVAPSFSVAYKNNSDKFISALREIGFEKVIETAFGADLIAASYKKIFEENLEKTIISSACPAIVNFIQKYYVELIGNLAEVVSPMVAISRYIRNNLGENKKIVFFGPCVAKKSEIEQESAANDVNLAITFGEINDYFLLKGIRLEELPPGNFDPPYAYYGKAYALPGGLLKSSEIPSDILAKRVIVVEGKNKVVEIIKAISEGKIKNKFVDILFCEGCISGPSIENDEDYYLRRETLIEYFESKINQVDKSVWKSEIYNNRNLNLRRTFQNQNQRRPTPSEEKIKEILLRTGKKNRQDELNCGACGYATCREYAIAIGKELAEEDMCLPYLIEKLEKAYVDLKTAQEQLHAAEKLASIGQLAAGVAHEINNPLGSILMYASILKRDFEKKEDLLNYVDDLNLMIEEIHRCKNIVSNLLNFARQGKLSLNEVDLYQLLLKIVKIVSLNENFKNVSFSFEKNCDSCSIYADEDQLKQVFINLLNNAAEAMEESLNKKIEIVLDENESTVAVKIKDYGCGIPKENMSKLFTPFFTTKKMGKGTGLGLAIAYGIIKMHKGDIKVKSEVGKGAEFILTFPKNL